MQHKNSFYTIPQLAKKMGLSRSQVFRKAQSGQIPAQKVGSIWLIDSEVASALAGDPAATDHRLIIKAVNKTVKEYGEVLKQLGNE